MIIASHSIYDMARAAPAGLSRAGAAPVDRSKAPSPAAPSQEPTRNQADLQARYFEDMVNSAADLLLRTQMDRIRQRE